MSNRNCIRLLIVEESDADAQALANELAQSGYPVSHRYTDSIEGVSAALATELPDLLICGSSTTLPTADRVSTLLSGAGHAVPIIAIADTAPESAVISARKAGISELVSYEHPEHLRLVFASYGAIVQMKQRISNLENALLGGEARCNALIRQSSDAIAYIHDGMHVYANQPYMDLFGIASPEEIGSTPVLDIINAGERDKFRDYLRQYQHGNPQCTTLDINCVSPARGMFSCSMECATATMDGEDCTQIIIRTTGNNPELEAQVRALSRTDSLTGLANRQHFMRELERNLRLQGATGERALLFVMLDDFKAIRESIGITQSDALLTELGAMLADACTERDLGARFGDYSFAVLRHDTDQAAILAMAERLLQEISSRLFQVDGRAVTLTASIGLCAITPATRNAQQLLTLTDMACEIARSDGGNRLHAHSAVQTDSTTADGAADPAVSAALEAGRICLVFQPIIRLKGANAQRYEVLARMSDTEGNVLEHDALMARVGRSADSISVDRWVIEHAAEHLAQQPDRARTVFHINITAQTMADPDVPAWIGNCIGSHALNGESFVFEIAQQHVSDDLAAAIAFITAMHEQHCKVAVARIGSELPPWLQHVPADILKIDSDLIQALAGDPQVRPHIKAITDMAHRHQMSSIAVGVPDAACLALLWQSDIDFIQGDFIQEPSRSLQYVFDSEIA